MRFCLTHEFDATIESIEAAAFDPDLFPFLAREMPSKVAAVELLDLGREGDVWHRRVRYQPQPLIRRIGPKEIPPHIMEWVEESEYDRRTRVMRFRNVPTSRPVAERMANEGRITVQDLGNGRSRRTIEGELRIRFPILGALAERIIFSQAQGLLDEEARVFARFLAGAR